MRDMRVRAAIGLVAIAVAVSAATGAQAAGSAKVLYRGIWTGNMAGWTHGGDAWTVQGKLLQYSGDAASVMLAPYTVTRTSYAVQAKIKLIAFKDTGLSESRGYGIDVRATSAGDPTQSTVGLVAGVGRGFMGCDGVSSQAVFTTADTDFTSLKKHNASFQPSHAWHLFRVEVRGNAIKLIVDGHVENTVTTKRFAGGTLVGLYSLGANIQVKSFSIYGL